MPEEIVMPRLSDTMEEGTIAQWLKHEGDVVHRGEAILEVETDKATMPLEAYSEGVIHKILQPEGTTVPIGTVIGLLAKVGEAVAPSPAATGGQARSAAAAVAADQQAAGPRDAEMPAGPAVAAGPAPSGQPSDNGAASNGAGGRLKATPLARNLARQHNIDLAVVGAQGSGPGGRIVRLDIERYMAQQGAASAAQPAPAQAQPAPTHLQVAATQSPEPTPPASDGVEFKKPTRIQQVMARRLVESKTTVPHFYVQNEVDMAAAADLRKQLQGALGDEGKVSYNDIVIKACALALRAMPEVNTQWRDGQFALLSAVNIGMAVNIPDGLVVPVIRDADHKTLREISAEARALAAKGREGKLAPREMEGGSFTVSNLGMFDVEEFQAIVNPPESAILAVGSIQEKPAVVDGQVVVRPRMKLTLSVDHRVIPGVPAAQFLQKVKQLLQEPLRLGF